jgi:hypothetical protein
MLAIIAAMMPFLSQNTATSPKLMARKEDFVGGTAAP